MIELIILPEPIVSLMKFILVGIIIIGMMMLLMGINHLTKNDDSITDAEKENFKSEVDDNANVITKESVFHNFLAREQKKSITKH